MRNQRSPCTLSFYQNLSESQMSSAESCNYDNESYLDINPVWAQSQSFYPNQISNAYQSFPQYDYSAAGDMSPQNFYLQNTNNSQTNPDNIYMTYADSWNPIENVPFSGLSANDPYALPIEYGVPFIERPFQQCVLQYGMPTVTDYGTVALLLRHLICVDLTADGSVSVYNVPAMSGTTLNAAGNKCYIKHPNGVVYQEGHVMHMMSGNDRLVKISRRGVAFSSALQSLAYIVDEAGTRTTTAKFTDLSKDLTMDVFYEGNHRSYEEIGQENYRMATDSIYKNYSNGGELWVFGRIRIMQDRWGQVIVTHNNSHTTIKTSPTIRSMRVDSPSASINIDCYFKNYFTIRKDACLVTSGFCGLIVQNQSQKAGLDRSGRLVLF